MQVCGIVRNLCVPLTAFDALQKDLGAIVVSDACACHLPSLDETTVKLYEDYLLAPLFRTVTVSETLQEL